jgi:hypothetical protein
MNSKRHLEMGAIGKGLVDKDSKEGKVKIVGNTTYAV